MDSTAQLILSLHQGNQWLFTRHAQGLSDGDALLQPPFPGNCMNWTLGHVVASRHRSLRLLDESDLWPAERVDLYRRGSQPLTAETSGRLRLEELLQALEQTMASLERGFGRISAESLAAAPKDEQTLAQQLAGLAWHETFHAGHVEFQRKLAGYNDPIIP